MKRSDLNGFSVQEMNAEEMKKTNGGCIWILVGLIVLAAIDIIQDGKLDGHIDI